MHAMRLKCKKQKWDLLFRQCKLGFSSYYRENTCHHYSSCRSIGANALSSDCLIKRRHVSGPTTSLLFRNPRYDVGLCETYGSQSRFFSSEGDGRSASEDKIPLKDVSNFEIGQVREEKLRKDRDFHDAHALLGEEDQKEWLINERLAIENKRKESPFLTKRERFKNEFLRRVIPWEAIRVSWDTFPYHINENAKNLLVECAASHLKHKKFTAAYGSHLASSSGRILLQSVPGTELYRERLVRALARGLQVPLLVLDSSVLASYDYDQDSSESELEDDHVDSGEEVTSESEVDDENEASNEEEYASSGESRSDDEDVSVEALKKLVPFDIEQFAQQVSGELESTEASSKPEEVLPTEDAKQLLKKGDRVKYVGPSVTVEADNRSLPTGQRGQVYEVNGDRVAVILDESAADETKEEEKLADQTSKPSIYWIHAKYVERDLDSEAEDYHIAIDAMSEVLRSVQPLIVYFPDSSLWLARAVSKAKCKEFLNRLQETFDQISGPVVLICGQNKVETGSREKGRLTVVLPNLIRVAKLPLPLKRLTEGLKGAKRPVNNEIHKLFPNTISVCPPKDEDQLKIFNQQIEKDRRIVISWSNIIELHKVIEENELLCMDLLHVITDGVILTEKKAEKVVGWARNHYLSSCLLPSVKGERLNVPRESIDIAIQRLKDLEAQSEKPSQNLKAKDEYEKNFISAVVPPGEIGVKFDDIGALEDVKRALSELVILPMRRPELFTRGNLLRPCKGILLFGPPGTGKTLLAKALATEAGANFISVTGSTLTSKWFGDAEKLTKALFSFATRLAPVIVFVDEVDSLLGARGGGYEHEATRRMRNEFMSAWDGLRSKDSQRILILGATNRPFDLDDAVIRRLPRRIYVDLPDAENRFKILKIFLAQENLEPGFDVRILANATEGYSGSDLKNLCIAAAYRPVKELLVEEKKSGRANVSPVLRPLHLDDFIQSKSKVSPSVAYDAASMNELRKWNEQYGEGGSRRKSPFGF